MTIKIEKLTDEQLKMIVDDTIAFREKCELHSIVSRLEGYDGTDDAKRFVLFGLLLAFLNKEINRRKRSKKKDTKCQ